MYNAGFSLSLNTYHPFTNSVTAHFTTIPTHLNYCSHVLLVCCTLAFPTRCLSQSVTLVVSTYASLPLVFLLLIAGPHPF
ncbi:hypothetical protein BC629DRAFT_1532799 [Irpex lacteus]|nr:hypothetical protein BC629DRAFT_1532799 [Irpex lacteus]